MPGITRAMPAERRRGLVFYEDFSSLINPPIVAAGADYLFIAMWAKALTPIQIIDLDINLKHSINQV